jgi:hypothetical protein
MQDRFAQYDLGNCTSGQVVEVTGSNPAPATIMKRSGFPGLFAFPRVL